MKTGFIHFTVSGQREELLEKFEKRLKFIIELNSIYRMRISYNIRPIGNYYDLDMVYDSQLVNMGITGGIGHFLKYFSKCGETEFGYITGKIDWTGY